MRKKEQSQGTALITGGAKRIGKAICLVLTAHGYTIALHYQKSSQHAKSLADAIRKKGGTCTLFDCDLSDERQTRQLISDVRKKCGSLNVLINNASIFEPSMIKSNGLASLHRHFAVNFNAPYILTSQFAKTCKRGHIINILDTHITSNTTRYADYLLSKKALSALTQISAVELAPHIRVNAVAPGMILPSTHTKSNQLKRMANKIPLRKKGNVDQIAQSVLFLLSNPYITGQIIFNDGGEHLGGN